MKIAVYILSKTIVSNFYQKYALFFMFGLFFCFGIMKSEDHIILNEYILMSGSLFWLYFLVWTLYNLLTINYFIKSIRQSNHQFLYDLYLLSPTERLLSIIATQTQLLLPVIGYALFVLFIALGHGLWQYLWYFLSFIVFTLAYSSFFYNDVLKKPDVGFKGISIILPFSKYFTKPAFSFYFFEIGLKHTVLLFMSKTASCLMLAGSLFIFQSDNLLDRRPLLLSLLLCVVANVSIVSLYHSFENQTLLYFRNLPISTFRIFGKVLATCLIIMLPETILVARILPYGAYAIDLLFIILYAPCLLMLYYSLQYLPQAATDSFGNWIFFGGFTCFVLVMFGMPAYLFIVLSISIAFLLSEKLYYKYEYRIKNTGDTYHSTND